MRFFCEWCFERVEIENDHSPHAEVLRHFSDCPRRPPAASDATVAGLAAHITSVITSGEEAESESGNVA